MIIAVRAHDKNPWLLRRLRLLKGYYEPAPHILVTDFGSSAEYSASIKSICSDSGFEYVYIDDKEVFSLARARNIGAIHASTELLFFNDIDCFSERDFFARLVQMANAISISKQTIQMINIPAYHLNELYSEYFEQAENETIASVSLGEAFALTAYAKVGEVTDLVAPYSNVFLCHRGFFQVVGGYNESFRGHGSEDFEFLLRFAIIAGQFPQPKEPNIDSYGPLSPSFYSSEKTYMGFRRLFEVMGFQAEIAGLRIAHLHHPFSDTADSWVQNKDKKRKLFGQMVEPFLSSPSALLHCDWLPRCSTALVVVDHSEDVLCFAQLRLSGHRLELLDAENSYSYGDAIRRIEQGDVTILAMSKRTSKAPSIKKIVDTARRTGVLQLLTTQGVESVVPRFSTDSYCGARLGLGLYTPDIPADELFSWKRLARKLVRNPQKFLEDSRFSSMRWISSFFEKNRK